MKVYYPAIDRNRLADETYKLYADPEHPDLKGKKLASTGYIGPVDRVIQGKGPTVDLKPLLEAQRILNEQPVPTEGRQLLPEVSAEVAQASADATPAPELTPAQKAAATRAANKAKADDAKAKREAKKAKKEATQ